MSRGLTELEVVMTAFNGRGPWYNSGLERVGRAYPKEYFDRLGLVSLLDELYRFRGVGLRNRLGT